VALDRSWVLLMARFYTLPVLLLSWCSAFPAGARPSNAAGGAVCGVHPRSISGWSRQPDGPGEGGASYVEAAQSLGAGPLWILRRLPAAQRDHLSVPCCSPSTLPTNVTRAGRPGLPGPGAPRIDFRNGAPTLQAGSPPRCPGNLVDGRSIRPGDVLCWYWAFRSWRGPGGLGEDGGDGAREGFFGGKGPEKKKKKNGFSTAEASALSALRSPCFSLILSLLLQSIFGKEQLALIGSSLFNQFMIKLFPGLDETLAQGSTPCASRIPCKPSKIELFTLVEL